MRDGPFYAVFFGSYEISVNILKTSTLLPDEACFFISGGLAGMVGWGAVIPADGPKSIIQASWTTGVAGDFGSAFRTVVKVCGCVVPTSVLNFRTQPSHKPNIPTPTKLQGARYRGAVCRLGTPRDD